MKIKGKRLTAFFTVWTLTVTQIGVTSDAWARPVTEIHLPSASFNIDVPQDLGTVQTLFSGNGPALIHIQTAHGHYEAQKKIQALLHHLNKNYGFKLLLLEGSAFKLHPELLRFFPNYPDLTREIADELTQKSWVKGSELFLLESEDARAYGIEDSKGYVANGRSFVGVLRQKTRTESFLRELDREIELLASKSLTPYLRSFLKHFEMYETGNLSVDDWLSQLKRKARQHLGIDLASPGYQLDWPMLFRLFKLKEFEAKLDPGKFKIERRKFLPLLRVLPREERDQIHTVLNSSLSQQALPDPETGLLFERMTARLPGNFRFEDYPNLTLFIGHLILQSELKGERLFKEMADLTEKISQRLASTPEAREILERLKDYRLLKKLFALELTPDEYEIIFSRRKNLTSYLQKEEIRLLFEKALEFYEGAKSRDGLMLQNIEKRLRETGEGKAVVITGGFHTRPFTEYFRKKNYNYALISPVITASEGREAYVESILRFQQGGVPSSTYEGVNLVTATRSELRRLEVDTRAVKEAIFGLARNFISRKAEKEILAREFASSAFTRQYGVRAETRMEIQSFIRDQGIQVILKEAAEGGARDHIDSHLVRNFLLSLRTQAPPDAYRKIESVLRDLPEEIGTENPNEHDPVQIAYENLLNLTSRYLNGKPLELPKEAEAFPLPLTASRRSVLQAGAISIFLRPFGSSGILANRRVSKQNLASHLSDLLLDEFMRRFQLSIAPYEWKAIENSKDLNRFPNKDRLEIYRHLVPSFLAQVRNDYSDLLSRNEGWVGDLWKRHQRIHFEQPDHFRKEGALAIQISQNGHAGNSGTYSGDEKIIGKNVIEMLIASDRFPVPMGHWGLAVKMAREFVGRLSDREAGALARSLPSSEEKTLPRISEKMREYFSEELAGIEKKLEEIKLIENLVWKREGFVVLREGKRALLNQRIPLERRKNEIEEFLAWFRRSPFNPQSSSLILSPLLRSESRRNENPELLAGDNRDKRSEMRTTIGTVPGAVSNTLRGQRVKALFRIWPVRWTIGTLLAAPALALSYWIHPWLALGSALLFVFVRSVFILKNGHIPLKRIWSDSRFWTGSTILFTGAVMKVIFWSAMSRASTTVEWPFWLNPKKLATVPFLYRTLFEGDFSFNFTLNYHFLSDKVHEKALFWTASALISYAILFPGLGRLRNSLDSRKKTILSLLLFALFAAVLGNTVEYFFLERTINWAGFVYQGSPADITPKPFNTNFEDGVIASGIFSLVFSLFFYAFSGGAVFLIRNGKSAAQRFGYFRERQGKGAEYYNLAWPLRVWGFFFPTTFGRWTTLRGDEKIPEEGPALLVGNHFGFLDSVFLVTKVALLRKRLPLFLARVDTKGSFGWLFWILKKILIRWGIIIPLEKGLTKEQVKEKILKLLRAGRIVALFPGNEIQSHADDALRGWRTTIAEVAYELMQKGEEVPLIPFGSSGRLPYWLDGPSLWKLFIDLSNLGLPLLLNLQFGEPVKTSTGVAEIMENLERATAALIPGKINGKPFLIEKAPRIAKFQVRWEKDSGKILKELTSYYEKGFVEKNGKIQVILHFGERPASEEAWVRQALKRGLAQFYVYLSPVPDHPIRIWKAVRDGLIEFWPEKTFGEFPQFIRDRTVIVVEENAFRSGRFENLQGYIHATVPIPIKADNKQHQVYLFSSNPENRGLKEQLKKTLEEASTLAWPPSRAEVRAAPPITTEYLLQEILKSRFIDPDRFTTGDVVQFLHIPYSIVYDRILVKGVLEGYIRELGIEHRGSAIYLKMTEKARKLVPQAEWPRRTLPPKAALPKKENHFAKVSSEPRQANILPLVEVRYPALKWKGSLMDEDSDAALILDHVNSFTKLIEEKPEVYFSSVKGPLARFVLQGMFLMAGLYGLEEDRPSFMAYVRSTIEAITENNQPKFRLTLIGDGRLSMGKKNPGAAEILETKRDLAKITFDALENLPVAKIAEERGWRVEFKVDDDFRTLQSSVVVPRAPPGPELEPELLAVLSRGDEHRLDLLVDQFGPFSGHRRSLEELLTLIRNLGNAGRIKRGGRLLQFIEKWDPKTGAPAGFLVSLKKVHDRGLWHVLSQPVLVSSQGKLLLQIDGENKRDWTGKAHVELGEKPEDAAFRALYEALPLQKSNVIIDKSRLILLPHPLNGENFFRQTLKKRAVHFYLALVSPEEFQRIEKSFKAQGPAGRKAKIQAYSLRDLPGLIRKNRGLFGRSLPPYLTDLQMSPKFIGGIEEMIQKSLGTKSEVRSVSPSSEVKPGPMVTRYVYGESWIVRLLSRIEPQSWTGRLLSPLLQWLKSRPHDPKAPLKLNFDALQYEGFVRHLNRSEREEFESYLMKKIADVLRDYEKEGNWDKYYQVNESGQIRHDFWDPDEELTGEYGVLSKMKFYDLHASRRHFIEQLVISHILEQRGGTWQTAAWETADLKNPAAAAEFERMRNLMRDTVDKVINKYLAGDIRVPAFVHEGYARGLLPHRWQRFILRMNSLLSTETVENLSASIMISLGLAGVLALLRYLLNLEATAEFLSKFSVEIWKIRVNIVDLGLAVFLVRVVLKKFLDWLQYLAESVEKKYYRRILDNYISGITPQILRRKRRSFDRDFSAVRRRLIDEAPAEDRPALEKLFKEVRRVLLDTGFYSLRYVRFVNAGRVLAESKIGADANTVLLAMLSDAKSQNSERFDRLVRSWEIRRRQANRWWKIRTLGLGGRHRKNQWDRLLGLVPLIDIQQHDGYRDRYARRIARAELERSAHPEKISAGVFEKMVRAERFKIVDGHGDEYHEDFMRKFIRRTKEEIPHVGNRRQIILSYFGGTVVARLQELEAAFAAEEKVNTAYIRRLFDMAERYWPRMLDSVRRLRNNGEIFGVSDPEIDLLKDAIRQAYESAKTRVDKSPQITPSRAEVRSEDEDPEFERKLRDLAVLAPSDESEDFVESLRVFSQASPSVRKWLLSLSHREALPLRQLFVELKSDAPGIFKKILTQTSALASEPKRVEFLQQKIREYLTEIIPPYSLLPRRDLNERLKGIRELIEVKSRELAQAKRDRRRGQWPAILGLLAGTVAASTAAFLMVLYFDIRQLWAHALITFPLVIPVYFLSRVLEKNGPHLRYLKNELAALKIEEKELSFRSEARVDEAGDWEKEIARFVAIHWLPNKVGYRIEKVLDRGNTYYLGYAAIVLGGERLPLRSELILFAKDEKEARRKAALDLLNQLKKRIDAALSKPGEIREMKIRELRRQDFPIEIEGDDFKGALDRLARKMGWEEPVYSRLHEREWRFQSVVTVKNPKAGETLASDSVPAGGPNETARNLLFKLSSRASEPWNFDFPLSHKKEPPKPQSDSLKPPLPKPKRTLSVKTEWKLSPLRFKPDSSQTLDIADPTLKHGDLVHPRSLPISMRNFRKHAMEHRGESVVWVGGAVRDAMLGLPIADFDIQATAEIDASEREIFLSRRKKWPLSQARFVIWPSLYLKSEHLIRNLSRFRKSFKTSASPMHELGAFEKMPVHFAFGTLVSPEGEILQVSPDLSINTMVLGVNDRFLDPWNGRGDLEAKIARLVGPIDQMDLDTVLRAFRFKHRLNLEWHGDTRSLLTEFSRDLRRRVDSLPILKGERFNSSPHQRKLKNIWRKMAEKLFRDVPDPDDVLKELDSFGFVEPLKKIKIDLELMAQEEILARRAEVRSTTPGPAEKFASHRAFILEEARALVKDLRKGQPLGRFPNDAEVIQQFLSRVQNHSPPDIFSERALALRTFPSELEPLLEILPPDEFRAPLRQLLFLTSKYLNLEPLKRDVSSESPQNPFKIDRRSLLKLGLTTFVLPSSLSSKTAESLAGAVVSKESFVPPAGDLGDYLTEGLIRHQAYVRWGHRFDKQRQYIDSLSNIYDFEYGLRRFGEEDHPPFEAHSLNLDNFSEARARIDVQKHLLLDLLVLADRDLRVWFQEYPSTASALWQIAEEYGQWGLKDPEHLTQHLQRVSQWQLFSTKQTPPREKFLGVYYFPEMALTYAEVVQDFERGRLKSAEDFYWAIPEGHRLERKTSILFDSKHASAVTALLRLLQKWQRMSEAYKKFAYQLPEGLARDILKHSFPNLPRWPDLFKPGVLKRMEPVLPRVKKYLQEKKQSLADGSRKFDWIRFGRIEKKVWAGEGYRSLSETERRVYEEGVKLKRQRGETARFLREFEEMTEVLAPFFTSFEDSTILPPPRSPGKSEVRSNSEKAEREEFYWRLNALFEEGWLWQKPEEDYRDHEAFEFAGNPLKPSQEAVMGWSEAKFQERKRWLDEIIQHRAKIPGMMTGFMRKLGYAIPDEKKMDILQLFSYIARAGGPDLGQVPFVLPMDKLIHSRKAPLLLREEAARAVAVLANTYLWGKAELPSPVANILLGAAQDPRKYPVRVLKVLSEVLVEASLHFKYSSSLFKTIFADQKEKVFPELLEETARKWANAFKQKVVAADEIARKIDAKIIANALEDARQRDWRKIPREIQMILTSYGISPFDFDAILEILIYFSTPLDAGLEESEEGEELGVTYPNPSKSSGPPSDLLLTPFKEDGYSREEVKSLFKLMIDRTEYFSNQIHMLVYRGRLPLEAVEKWLEKFGEIRDKLKETEEQGRSVQDRNLWGFFQYQFAEVEPLLDDFQILVNDADPGLMAFQDFELLRSYVRQSREALNALKSLADGLRAEARVEFSREMQELFDKPEKNREDWKKLIRGLTAALPKGKDPTVSNLARASGGKVSAMNLYRALATHKIPYQEAGMVKLKPKEARELTRFARRGIADPAIFTDPTQELFEGALEGRAFLIGASKNNVVTFGAWHEPASGGQKSLQIHISELPADVKVRVRAEFKNDLPAGYKDQWILEADVPGLPGLRKIHYSFTEKGTLNQIDLSPAGYISAFIQYGKINDPALPPFPKNLFSFSLEGKRQPSHGSIYYGFGNFKILLPGLPDRHPLQVEKFFDPEEKKWFLTMNVGHPKYPAPLFYEFLPAKGLRLRRIGTYSIRELRSRRKRTIKSAPVFFNFDSIREWYEKLPREDLANLYLPPAKLGLAAALNELAQFKKIQPSSYHQFFLREANAYQYVQNHPELYDLDETFGSGVREAVRFLKWYQRQTPRTLPSKDPDKKLSAVSTALVLKHAGKLTTESFDSFLRYVTYVLRALHLKEDVVREVRRQKIDRRELFRETVGGLLKKEGQRKKKTFHTMYIYNVSRFAYLLYGRRLMRELRDRAEVRRIPTEFDTPWTSPRSAAKSEVRHVAYALAKPLYLDTGISTRGGRFTFQFYKVDRVKFSPEVWQIIRQRIGERGSENEGQYGLHWVREAEIKNRREKKLDLRVPVKYLRTGADGRPQFEYGTRSVPIEDHVLPLLEGAVSPSFETLFSSLGRPAIRVSTGGMALIERDRPRGRKEYLLGININRVTAELKKNARTEIYYVLKPIGGGLTVSKKGIDELKRRFQLDPDNVQEGQPRYEEEIGELRISDFPTGKLAEYLEWLQREILPGGQVESLERELIEELGTIEIEKDGRKLPFVEYGLFDLEETPLIFSRAEARNQNAPWKQPDPGAAVRLAKDVFVIEDPVLLAEGSDNGDVVAMEVGTAEYQELLQRIQKAGYRNFLGPRQSGSVVNLVPGWSLKSLEEEDRKSLFTLTAFLAALNQLPPDQISGSLKTFLGSFSHLASAGFYDLEFDFGQASNFLINFYAQFIEDPQAGSGAGRAARRLVSQMRELKPAWKKEFETLVYQYRKYYEKGWGRRWNEVVTAFQEALPDQDTLLFENEKEVHAFFKAAHRLKEIEARAMKAVGRERGESLWEIARILRKALRLHRDADAMTRLLLSGVRFEKVVSGKNISERELKAAEAYFKEPRTSLEQALEAALSRRAEMRSQSVGEKSRRALNGEEAIQILEKTDADISSQVKAIKRLQELDAQDRLGLIAGKLEYQNGKESWKVRKAAVIALGDMKARDYHAAIAERLKDSYGHIQTAAISALTKLNMAQYAQAVEPFKNSPNAKLRSAAQAYWRHFGLDQRGMTKKKAISILTGHTDSRDQITAIKRLQELDAQDQFILIGSKLKAQEWKTRSAALVALNSMGARVLGPKIAELLDDTNSHVRQTAISAFKELNLPEHEEKIRSLMDSRRLTMLKSGASYLRHFGLPGHSIESFDADPNSRRAEVRSAGSRLSDTSVLKVAPPRAALPSAGLQPKDTQSSKPLASRAEVRSTRAESRITSTLLPIAAKSELRTVNQGVSRARLNFQMHLRPANDLIRVYLNKMRGFGDLKLTYRLFTGGKAVGEEFSFNILGLTEHSFDLVPGSEIEIYTRSSKLKSADLQTIANYIAELVSAYEYDGEKATEESTDLMSGISVQLYRALEQMGLGQDDQDDPLAEGNRSETRKSVLDFAEQLKKEVTEEAGKILLGPRSGGAPLRLEKLGRAFQEAFLNYFGIPVAHAEGISAASLMKRRIFDHRTLPSDAAALDPLIRYALEHAEVKYTLSAGVSSNEALQFRTQLNQYTLENYKRPLPESFQVLGIESPKLSAKLNQLISEEKTPAALVSENRSEARLNFRSNLLQVQGFPDPNQQNAAVIVAGEKLLQEIPQNVFYSVQQPDILMPDLWSDLLASLAALPSLDHSA